MVTDGAGEARTHDVDEPGPLEELGIGVETTEAVGEALGGLPPHGRLARTLYWIGAVELVVGVTLIGVILVLVLIQVTQRYLPGGGWVWTGEIARFSLVWSTLALSGYLMAHDRHITLEVIDHIASPRQLRIIKRVADLVVALISVAMIYESYQLITERSGQVSPASRMPLTWVYILPFVGFVLTALRAAIATLAPAPSIPTDEQPAPEPDELDYP